MRRIAAIVSLCVFLGAACAPAGQPGQPAAGGAAPPAAPKAIAIGLDEDVKNLWDAITLGGGSGARQLANMVNQHLVAITSDGSPTPRLLAELPSFQAGTWRVLADGKMETTYKLRPNVFWHDGTPFTPQDLLFSYEVNRDTEVPNSNQETILLVERMEIADPTTVVATWKQPYPFADRLEHRELYPLPRHILESPYRASKEAFTAHSYFSVDFVGLGPYRINNWLSGSHLDLAAFDRFFLGRPKIDSIRIQFIPDPTTMLANLRARSIQMMLTLGGIPEFEQLMLIKQEWEQTGYGTMIMDPISYRFVEPQKFHNPQPPDLVDPRVRQALLHGINRAELARAVLGEHGIVADSWVHPSFGHYPRMQDVITRYPYDPRRASQLLAEAGWRAGADGILEKGGQRFHLALRDTDGERDALIIGAGWKEIGVSSAYEQRTAAALRDRQDRATFTGADITSNPMGVAAVVRRIASYNIPTEQNRWTGTNRGGYQNPAWDDLERRMLAALEESVRLDLERELLRIYTTDLPLLPLYFRNDVIPVGNHITGVKANTGVAHRGFILHTWNIHEWDPKP